MRKKKGLSTVASTIILSSVMLFIVLGTSALVTQIFNVEAENAEFSQAKYVMQSLVDAINNLIYKPYSSNYIRTGFRTTMPQLVSTGENLEIWIDDALVSEIPVRIVMIQGGLKVNAMEENIIGSSNILLTNLSYPLGRVYVQRNDRAEIILDFSRARVSYLGTYEFYDGGDENTYNVVEIIAVNLSFGTIQAHEESTFSIRNLGLDFYQIEKSGNFTISIKLSDSEESVSLEDLGGDLLKPTLINLEIVNIQISLYGGS